jgi:hypothetical protein
MSSLQQVSHNVLAASVDAEINLGIMITHANIGIRQMTGLDTKQCPTYHFKFCFMRNNIRVTTFTELWTIKEEYTNQYINRANNRYAVGGYTISYAQWYFSKEIGSGMEK